MTVFPQRIDPTPPPLKASDTLATAKHTALHQEAINAVLALQSFLGDAASDTNADTAKLRGRVRALEKALANATPPVLKFAVNQLAPTAIPTVNWNAGTSTLTLGIPGGLQGPSGSPGSPGHFVSGLVGNNVYPPGVGPKDIQVSFPAASFSTAPRVFVTPVQKTTGTSTTPLLVGVRDITSVGFTLIIENTGPNTERVEVNWLAI